MSIPMVLLLNVRMPWRKKLAFLAIFSVSMITIGVSIARAATIVALQKSNGLPDGSHLWFWSSCQSFLCTYSRLTSLPGKPRLTPHPSTMQVSSSRARRPFANCSQGRPVPNESRLGSRLPHTTTAWSRVSAPGTSDTPARRRTISLILPLHTLCTKCATARAPRWRCKIA